MKFFTKNQTESIFSLVMLVVPLVLFTTMITSEVTNNSIVRDRAINADTTDNSWYFNLPRRTNRPVIP